MAKHKCKIPDPPPDTSRWMGTYGDMVTLLMAFFVMLFAVSETNNQKFVAFVSGLAGPFDNPALELGLVDGAALQEASQSPISMIAPMSGARTDVSDPGEMTEEEAGQAEEEAEAEDQLQEISEDIREILDESDTPIIVDVRDDERGLVVSISTDEILFDVGSATLSSEGQELIAEFAPLLVAAPNTIVVEGHTDNTPINREDYSNWNLSTDRAVAVVELLGDVHGLSFERVSAAGFGEHRPLVPNDTEENRSINRRVEILIVGMDVSGGGAPAPPPSQGAPADRDPRPADDTADAPDGEMTATAPDAGDRGDDFAPPAGEEPRPIDPGVDPDVEPDLEGEVAAAAAAGTAPNPAAAAAASSPAGGAVEGATLASMFGQ